MKHTLRLTLAILFAATTAACLGPQFTKRYDKIVATTSNDANVALDVSAQLVPNTSDKPATTLISLDPAVQAQALKAISRKESAKPDTITELLGSRIGKSKPGSAPIYTKFEKRIALLVDLPLKAQRDLSPADRFERLDTTITLSGSQNPRFISWSKLVCPEVTADLGDLTFKQSGTLGATAGFDTLSPDLSALEIKGELARELTETIRLRETRLACYGVPEGSSARIVQNGVLGRRITGVQTIDMIIEVERLSPESLAISFTPGAPDKKASLDFAVIYPPASCTPVTLATSAEGLFRRTIKGDDTVTESDDTVKYLTATGQNAGLDVELVSSEELRVDYVFILVAGTPISVLLPGDVNTSALRFVSVSTAETFLGWMSAQEAPPQQLGAATLSLGGNELTQSNYRNAYLAGGMLNAAQPDCKRRAGK
ncbi:MAG: hypothetical protein KJ871_04450 [Alphaproteobacteria bacterium]|nr:hypothetical protein [Alphaproteobacteria bacterium]MBU2083942.1 hypothetical protein [Alphaproteobacteria bacterium]MBU2142294.1 hypothetical protein [Alphaproteobacteria bacterium]MBU2196492.1 hypothetical protein [Alphaproteobacteria bacterium]